jgi:hypothetical protein
MGLTRPRAHQLQDIDYKQTARVITTANVTLSGGAPATVDGTSLALANRVLVTAQTTGTENGIYEVTVVGSGSNGTWVRTEDANATGDIKGGTIIMITEGTVYADTQWKLTTDNPITIGSTALTFARNGNAAFGVIAVSGQSDLVSDQIGDTLTLVAGSNVTLTTNAGTDTLTIAAGGGGATVSSDTTTNAERLIYVGSTTTGTLSAVTQDSGLTYNPSTGSLTSATFITGSQGELKFADADSSNYVGFKSPATVGTNLIWTLPATDGTSGQALVTDASGVLSWADAGGNTGRTLFNYAITGTTTTVTGSDSGGDTLAYTAGQLDVFVNGVRMAPADITATNGTSVVFGDALVNGDVVDIIAYTVIDISQIGTGRTLFNYSISGTPTTVTGADSNGNTLAYTVGQIDVFVNGVRMAPVDITATNGTSVVFGSALANGDTVDIVTYTAFDVVTNNADDLSSGTVPTARVAGAYTGITSVGTLTGFTSTGIDDNADALAITIDSSEKVGIGTASPNEKLDVRGSLQVGVDGTTAGLIRFMDSGSVTEEATISSDANGGLIFGGNSGAGELIFKTGSSTERMRIDSAGNVGIGVVPEAWQSTRSALQVGDSTAVWGDVYQNSWFTSNVYRNSSNNEVYINASYAQQMSMDNGGNIVFKVAPSGSADATIGWTTAMTVDNSGKVGVGTTSAGLGIMSVHGATGGNATFKAANTSSSGNTTCIMAFMDGSGSATSNSAFLQGFNGVTSYYLLGNGTQTFTSDENVKKNIETTRDGYLEDLAKLRVVKYNWKHEEDGTNKELGLIAQEVEEVFPNLVMEDFDPQIEEGQRRNKMIKVTVLPFMLLKAIQELSAKNDALEARIATQATQIADLISRVTALENG